MTHLTCFGRLGPFRRHELRRRHFTSPLLVQQGNVLTYSSDLTFVLTNTDNDGHTLDSYL